MKVRVENEDGHVQRFLRSELSFYVSIIVSTAVIVGSYLAINANMMNNMERINYKLDNALSTISELRSENDKLDDRITAVEKDLIKLQK